MELSAITATLSPLAMPRAWMALARRLTRSWSSAKVRLSPSQVRAMRSGTTEAAIIRNSLVFIRYAPMQLWQAHRRCPAIRGWPQDQLIHIHHDLAVPDRNREPVQSARTGAGKAATSQVVCLAVARDAEPAFEPQEHEVRPPGHSTWGRR